MLRTVKTSRLAQRLIPFRVSTVATHTVEHGKDDIASLTDNGTGDTTITLNEPFRRVPVAIACPATSVGATGAASYAVAAGVTVSTVRFLSRSTAGAGSSADGVIEGVVVGADSPTEHAAGSPQRLLCTNPAPRVVALRLTAPDTLAEGKYQATVSAASNRSTIRLKYPFQQTPVVLVVSDTIATVANKVSASASEIVIDQFDLASDAASAGGAHILVIGQDIKSITGKARRALKLTQMAPRVIAGRVTVSGGSYSIADAYSDLGAVVKNGTGDFTLTFEKAFKRAPVVIPTSSTGNAVAVTSTSTTACTIKTSTSAGAAADANGDIHVLVVGFDYGVQS